MSCNHFRITDVSPLVVSDQGGGVAVDMSGTPVDFPSAQDIPNYVEIINASHLTLQAQGNITANKDVNITAILSIDHNQYRHSIKIRTYTK